MSNTLWGCQCIPPHWDNGVYIDTFTLVSGCRKHEQAHFMLPGSHERPGGPECRCGSVWDRLNDRCLFGAEVDRNTMSSDDVEYLEAVRDFHEPVNPPSACYWCGLPSPCPPYLEAQAALVGAEVNR